MARERSNAQINCSQPMNDAQPDSRFQSDRLVWIALSTLVLLAGAGNILWARLDAVPPAWDQASHLHIAYKYYQVFSTPTEQFWQDLLDVESYYPPLFHLSLAPLLGLSGFSTDAAAWINSFYVALIILATYGIGKELFDRQTGLMAAFLVVCYPFLASVSRQPLIDTALTAVVASGFYCSFRSNNFNHRKFSFLFSLVIALGFLVKWTFLFFLLPPVLMGLFSGDGESWRQKFSLLWFYLGLVTACLVLPFLIVIVSEWRWVPILLEVLLIYGLLNNRAAGWIPGKKIVNVMIMIMLPVVIAFPWYANNLVKMFKGLSLHAFRGEWEGDPTAGLDRWLFYLRALELQTGVFLFFLFLVGAVLWMIRKQDFNWTLITWIVFPYLIFSLISNKDTRYTLPCLPAVALVSAQWIRHLKRENVRMGIWIVLMLSGIGAYVFSGFTHHSLGRVTLPVLGEAPVVSSFPPVKQDWPIETILKDMMESSKVETGDFLIARTLTNHPYFHRGAFRNTAEISGLPIEVKIVKRNVGEMTDFFISKNDNLGPEFSLKDTRSKKGRLVNDPALRQTFPVFKTYPLPDGTMGVVYGRNVKPAHQLKGAGDLGQIGARFIEALAGYPKYGISQGENINVNILPTDRQEDIYLGRYKSITLTADSAVFSKVRIHNLKLVFEDVQINLYDLLLNGKLILFELGRLYPQATIRFEDVERRLMSKIKQDSEIRVEGEGDSIKANVRVDLPIGDITAEIKAGMIFQPEEYILPVVETLRLGPVTVPEIFYRRLASQKIGLKPTPSWPIVTDVRNIKIFPRELVVN